MLVLMERPAMEENSYPNSERVTQLQKMFPDMGSLPAVPPSTPTRIPMPNLPEETVANIFHRKR